MNCKEFEQLLADIWGNELADADRAVFERHLRNCETCRRQYESGKRALGAMQSLEGPRNVTARREKNRLIIEWPGDTVDEHKRHTESAGWGGAAKRVSRWSALGLFRYAAGILIAFTGGYAFHAGLMLSDARRTVDTTTTSPSQPGTGIDSGSAPVRGVTFQSALASAYTRAPLGSDFAKGLMALGASGD